MEPKLWPLDPASAIALLTRLLDQIDLSSEEQRDALLCELLRSAWGSILAQNQ